MSSLCVSQADDCRLLGKLPKVKCLRNGRREGKSCLPTIQVGNPDFGRRESDGVGGGTSVEWVMREVSGSWGMGGLDKNRCDKGLGFEMDPPSLTEKDGTIKISNEAQL